MMKSIKGINPEKGALWYLKKTPKKTFCFHYESCLTLEVDFHFLAEWRGQIVCFLLPAYPAKRSAKLVELPGVWPGVTTHVTGYPSVWLKREGTESLDHCCSMSHTFVYTRPLCSWREISATVSSNSNCKLHKDNVALFKFCCGPLCPCPSLLHHRWYRYVTQKHFCWLIHLWLHLKNISHGNVLLNFLFALLQTRVASWFSMKITTSA